MVGQCGDGSQGLERNSTGHSRLEESCDGNQCPPRAVVLIMMKKLSPETPCFDTVEHSKLCLTFVCCHIPLPLLNNDSPLCQTKVFPDISSLSHNTYFGILFHPWKYVGVILFYPPPSPPSMYMYIYIQGVPGGKDLTSGECSLGQTIPI